MSDSEQPINNPQPPRRNLRDPLRSKWGVALATSLVFHAGIGAVLALNPPRPVPPVEDRRPYTADTYAKKGESAQAKVRKMEQIARKMENLHRTARENYEKRTGQKLPPLPSTPATPPPNAPAAEKPNTELARSIEEARIAQDEVQEAQQNVETALREADAALAKGDLTGYRESARRAAQAARTVTEAQTKALAAQKKAEKLGKEKSAPKLPTEKPVIDAAMKQQIAAAQAQRTAQAEMVKAADAQTLETAKKAQAEAKAAQEESARKQAAAKKQQEAAAKQAEKANSEPQLPELPDISPEALQAMLSQGMALEALNMANVEAQKADQAEGDAPTEPEGAEEHDKKGEPGANKESSETPEGGKENGTTPPEKGSEPPANRGTEAPAPAKSQPETSAPGKPAGNGKTPTPPSSTNPTSRTGAPQPPAAANPGAGKPEARNSNTPESLKGVEKSLADAAKYQQEAAARQQAARNAPSQGGQGQSASGQNPARQQAQRQAIEAQRRAEQARQQAERALATGNPEAVERAVNNAVAAQRDAIAAQARANGNPNRPEGNQEGEASSGPPTTGRPGQAVGGGSSAPTGRQAPPNDLGNALATAQSTEARINSMYSEIRALERASTGRVPLNQARRETGSEGVGTGRDAVANTRITGPAAVTAQSPAHAVNEAEQKIDAMAARAQRMLDQAQAQQGSSARLFADRMVSLAGQETGGRTADLSGLMNNEGPNRTRRRLPGDPDYIAPPPPPALPDASIKAFPGRRVTRGNAPPLTWMYVDTWYVVGPFPNPARQNLNTKFPPETRVDLDATYPGMGGRKLKWQFWQFNSPEMVPPDHQEYAIYYYYTELYFETPRDAWVAVGSDDQSTLWLNGQLAWKSSDQLKGWQMGEGLRRVHFKAGRNPILVRLENGWRGAAVSVVVALKE